MDLVYSVALFALAVILFKLFVPGGRTPGKPGWASDGVINDLWCVTITGLIAFGGAFGVRFVQSFKEEALGLTEAVLVAALLFACYLIVRLMKTRRPRVRYPGELARGAAASEPSPAAFTTLTPSEFYDHSPGEPTLPKVA